MKLTDEDRAACERVERLMRRMRAVYVFHDSRVGDFRVAPLRGVSVDRYTLAEALEACDED